MKKTKRSMLMKLSWQIQKKRACNRSRSLIAAWAIINNEDITVFHLVKKHSHDKYPNKVNTKIALFN